MEGEAMLAGARRAAVHSAVTALCAHIGTAVPALPAVQGAHVYGLDAEAVTRYADLAHRVGEENARYALVRTRANRLVRLDLDRWARRDETNPLWRVRYVRARALLCLRIAAAYGEYPVGDHDVVAGRKLADALDAVPGVLTRAAELAEPHRIAEHLERRVALEFAPIASRLTTEPSTSRDAGTRDLRAHRSRLALAARCADAVAAALPLLGVTATDRV
ncbi:MAG: DALR anticodon-binding domain-containing protein [Streptosporangiales bacterium]